MKYRIYLMVVIQSLLLLGCVTQQDRQNETRTKMDSWMGSHKSQLIQSWGPPSRYASDGQDGEILIYEKRRTVGSYISGTYYEKTYVDYIEMYANSSGKLYHWRTGTK